jgi:hypothetical protein
MRHIGYSYDEHAGLAVGDEAVRATPSASVARSAACPRTRRVACRHGFPPKLRPSAKGKATLGVRSLTHPKLELLPYREDLSDDILALASSWSPDTVEHYKGERRPIPSE